MGETEKAKAVMYKYLEAFPTVEAYVKVARMEQKGKNKDNARRVY